MKKKKSFINFVTEIKNSFTKGKRTCNVLYSEMVESIVKILIREGFVKGFYITYCKITKRKLIVIYLRFKQYENKGAYFSVIKNIRIGNKIKDKIYFTHKDILKVKNYQLLILSTNFGVIDQMEAKKYKIGGKLLFYIE